MQTMQKATADVMRAGLDDALEVFALRTCAINKLREARVISARRCLAELERMWQQTQRAATTVAGSGGSATSEAA